jgi:hypothetical protein
MERPDNISLENWNELTRAEKAERLLPKDVQDKHLREAGMMDCNDLTLDQLSEYLEKQWMFSSSIDALAIHKLIEFYRQNK